MVGFISTLITISHVAYMMNIFNVITTQVASPMIDVSLILISVLGLLIMFWLLYVTYSPNSLVVKYFTKKPLLENEKGNEPQTTETETQIKTEVQQ